MGYLKGFLILVLENSFNIFALYITFKQSKNYPHDQVKGSL